jgi:hypothetical protein
MKDAYRRPIIPKNIIKAKFDNEIYENIALNDEGYAVSDGVSLVDPKVCSAILCNYSKLKGECEARFNSDLYYLLESFDKISETALEKYPLYKKIVIYKIDGL